MRLHTAGRALLLVVAATVLCGCYGMRTSQGGGQTAFEPPRRINPADVALPPGYRIEAVATGLTFPSAVVTDDANRLYVVEAGYSYHDEFAVPRLLRVEPDGSTTVIASGEAPPWTGASFHDGAFYISASGEPGRILRVTLDGEISTVLDNLPYRTDHFTTRPLIGPDGWLYFGQGSATNAGVVGEDNFNMGWPKRLPTHHDIPCRDVTLTGQNFKTANFLEPESREEVDTGAYVPFGTATQPGQVLRRQLPCTAAIMRVRPDGTQLELVAWGLRHPFGLAFHPDGRLFATDNSYDERGSRQVFGAGDYLWAVEPGLWYGFPDYAGGRPLTDRRFQSIGAARLQFLFAEHPNRPPMPAAYLGVHSSSNGLDFSRNADFGHVGQAFIAQFGDMAASVGKVLFPVGFKVVRVAPESGVVEDFVANKGKVNGPASFLGSGGLERPVDVQFDRTGTALYIADFGVMTINDRAHPRRETGVIWRVTRTGPGPVN